MALKVGAGYIDFYIERKGFKEGREEILSGLAAIRDSSTATTKAASDVAAATRKILNEYKKLAAELKQSRPFDELAKNAREAYVEIVGNSTIPDLADESIDVVTKLRRQLAQARPFDPLAENAEKNADALDQLRERAEALEQQIDSIGISREQLKGVIDGEGRVRDTVTVRADRQDSGERGQRNQYRADFGNVSRDATSRYEAIQEQADPGTRAALARDTEEVKQLVEEQAAAYDELARIKLQISNAEIDQQPTRPTARPGREAAAALADYEQAAEALRATTQAAEQTEARAEQLQQRYENLGVAAATYGEDTEKGARAAYLAAAAQADLENTIERYQRQLDQLSTAEDNHRDSLARLTRAQQALADAVADEQRAEQAAQATRQQAQRSQPAQAAQPARPRSSSSSTAQAEQLKADQRQQEQNHKERIEQLKIEQRQIETNAQIQVSINQKLAALAAEEARVDIAKAQANAAADARKVEAAERTAARIGTEEIKQRGRVHQEETRGRARIEQTAIRAGGKIAEAEIANNTKVIAARLSSESRIEAARIGALSRIEATQKRIDAQREAREAREAGKTTKTGGAALPRTFAGFDGSGLIELVGAFGLATTAAGAFEQSIQFLQEGEETARRLDETRRSTGALIESMDRGNRVYAAAIEFGQKYRFTNNEIAESLTALTPLIRQSSLDTEKQLEITARLAARNPTQGFDGAAFSISELANLDPVSIQERFNLPRAAAKRIIEEVKSGVDVFQALDRELLKLGNDASILALRLEGPSGAARDLTSATDDLKTALGGLFNDEATAGRQWAATMTRSAATAIEELTKLKRFVTENGKTGELLVTEQAGRGLIDAAKYAGSQALQGNLAGNIEDYGIMAALFGARLNVLTKEAAEVDPALAKIGDSASVLANRLSAEQLTIGQYAAELAKLSSTPPADISGLLANLDDLPAPERIERLQSLLANFQQQINIKPDIAANFLPQMQAVAAEIDRLKSTAPIVITVELRQRFQAQAASIASEAAERVKQTNQQLADLQTQYAARRSQLIQQAAANDRAYTQQQARAAREFAQTQSKAARDFAQGQARAARDFAQQERKAAEDLARQLADIQQKLGESLIKIERDTRQRLQQTRREYDIDQTRSREDYLEERQRLLAEGRISEADQLRRDFEKEQRRKAEDLARDQSDTADNGATEASEARTQAAEQAAQAREQYARQRAERAAAFAQQQADARAAYAQQQADARQAYAQQQADAAAAHTQQQAQLKAQQAAERTAYEQQRGQLISGLKAYLSEQKTKLDESQRNLLEATRRNVDLSIIEQEKALERSKTSLERGLATFEATIGNAGGRASGAYMREFAKRLELGATLLDPALKPTEDRLRPRSPIRTGPLKDLESAGRRAGQQYTDGLTGGINPRAIDPQLQALRQRMADQTAANAAGLGSAAASAPAPVVIVQVHPATIQIDGQTAGRQLAPHVSAEFERDLITQATTAAAATQPHRQQAVFREIS
jgi:hypothetical protein